MKKFFSCALPTIVTIQLLFLGTWAVYGQQSTPTNLPETNAPPTSTPRQFCHVQYLVFVNRGVGVNVRPTPSRDTTPIFVANGTANPYSAIGLQDGWFQLCSINGQYMVSDPALNSFVTVTPLPPTPTRIPVTSTPVATSTPTNLAKRICIQYDDTQGTQDVCGLFPVNARVVSIEITKVEP